MIESISQSPLYSMYGDAISGVVTVRAFGATTTYLREMLRCIDTVCRSLRSELCVTDLPSPRRRRTLARSTGRVRVSCGRRFISGYIGHSRYHSEPMGHPSSKPSLWCDLRIDRGGVSRNTWYQRRSCRFCTHVCYRFCERRKFRLN